MMTIRIDVSLLDEKVFSTLKDKLGDKPGELTLQTIAAAVRCHPVTAHRAIKRLVDAGRIESKWQGFSKPCIYQVLDD